MPGRVRPDIDLGVNPNPFRTCRTISGFPFTVQWLGFVMIALTEAMRFSSSTSPTGRGNDRRPGAPWLAWLRTGDTGAAGVVQAPLSCAEEARVSEIAEKRFASSAPVGVRTRGAPRGRQQPPASEAVLISAISLTRASFGEAAGVVPPEDGIRGFGRPISLQVVPSGIAFTGGRVGLAGPEVQDAIVRSGPGGVCRLGGNHLNSGLQPVPGDLHAGMITASLHATATGMFGRTAAGLWPHPRREASRADCSAYISAEAAAECDGDGSMR